MHILLIPISYPNSYSRQSHVFFEEQATALSRKGIKVGVLAVISISMKQLWAQKRVGLGFSEERINGVEVYRYLFPSIPKMRRFNLWLRAILGKRLFLKYQNKLGSPDIAHVHVSFAGNVAVWMNQSFEIPYVVTEHYTAFTEGNMPSWQIRSAKNVFAHSKKNIAVSKEFKASLEDDFHMKFEYIPNIVNTNFFIPNPKRGLRERIRHFVNIGNLNLQKNQEILIRAFYRSFKSQPEFKLVIAGSGPEEVRLKKIVIELGMQNQISFFGQADREEVVKLLQNSDCFVLSSKFETFGVVIIEAMSCGIPVIATRSGGPESIIKEKKLGILCGIDESQLSNALTEAANYRYDSYYIRKYTIENFSSDRVANRLKNIYAQIIHTPTNNSKKMIG